MSSATSPQIDAPTREDPILEVRDATVRFEMDRGVSRVLDSVNVDIPRDEVFGIVGESGSGKSMFASALMDAVVDPGVLSGDITYHPEDGDPIELLELTDRELKQFRWEEVSMVFQGAMSSFNPTMSIREHFEETIFAHNQDISERMEYARTLLSDLYLDPERVLGSYPHELSGGMQQRALIALSLVLEPEVLVMDEPTAALDLLMQRSITSLLADIQEEYNITILFITHDLPLVAGFADRLAVMYAFDFVEHGPADEIITEATHPYTRALLRSVPSLDTDIDEMRIVEGEAPDPVDVPKGCSYHPRCPIATEECFSEEPSYHQVKDDHMSACFHWDESADAISYSIGEGIVDEDREDTDRQQADPDELVPRTVDPSAGGEASVVSLEDTEVHFDLTDIVDRIRGDEEIVRAVDGVTLNIEENDVLAVVGESGCGKTTLGKTAVALQEATGGSVKYRGQDIWETFEGSVDDAEYTAEDIRRSLQIVHQDPGSSLNPSRTVRKSLATPLKKWRSDFGPADRERIINQLLEQVGMVPAEDYATRFPHQLSGGEKQRVALGRALLMNPDLILADEAVSALDVSLRVEMMDLMLELQDTFNTSYLFISHDFSNARYLAEKADGKIAIMYLGEIVEIGPVEEVLANPKHPYTKVLTWATPVVDPEKAKEAAKQDPPIRNIDIPDPVNPPSGCRFHTRCPEAREVCTRESPKLLDDGRSAAACFREDPGHEYWESESIVDEDPESDDTE
jgi:peptide/nickel transport system ATP-binding protein